MTVAAGSVFVLYVSSKPRVLAVSEVPIAFWAWRTKAPTAAEVKGVYSATKATTLFLRAGQIDLVDGSIVRIQPLSNSFPSYSADIHLVYNGTRRFLSQSGFLEPSAIADTVAKAYFADVERASRDNARISGIQLDFDVPTRLLPRYAQALRHLRDLLPAGTKLSITGLPTWAGSNDLSLVLNEVDFWIPQCYGTRIPTRVEQRIPISSASEVKQIVDEARRLDKPFYAGLSAYGYAILYGKDGGLVELRGDIDPDSASQNSSLELIESSPVKASEEIAGEFRYVYRASRDLVLDGLIMRPGESLVFDLPSSASLRAAARAVRENAGDSLLGICVFRLPTLDDKTNLGITEITTALNDAETKVATSLTISRLTDSKVKLSAANVGTAGTTLTGDALTIDLYIPAGSIDRVSDQSGYSDILPLCAASELDIPRPCSPLRANVLRLKATSWRPGATAYAVLSVGEKLPNSFHAAVTTHVDDGTVHRETFDLDLHNTGKAK